MTSVLYVPLGADASLTSAVNALPLPIMRLDLPDGNSPVSNLRELVEKAPGVAGAFILAVGCADMRSGLEGMNREQEVLVPLRQAFGVLTGAAKRFQAQAGGTIVVMIPSGGLGPASVATAQLVLLRSIVGMAEALRAECQDAQVRVSLFFHDVGTTHDAELAARLEAVLETGPLYSLSADITAEKINRYFGPLLEAVDQSSAGPPLPDIGPMAAVYDLHAAGAVAP